MLALAVVSFVIGASWLAWSVSAAYHAVGDDVARVEARAVTPTGSVRLTPHDLAPLAADLSQTHRDLRWLQRRLTTPIVAPLLRHMP